MNTEEPDFSRLTERLLSPHRFVELVPGELSDNGYAVRLVPARDGTKLDCRYVDMATLPTLDLVQAGIGSNQRPQTILAEVENLLKGHRFVIEPNFNLVWAIAGLPILGLGINVAALEITYRSETRFIASSGGDLDKYIEKEIRKVMMTYAIGFSIVNNGEPIKGLDIKSPQGSILPILMFLLPHNAKAYKGTVIEKEALQAGISYCEAKQSLSRCEREYEQYLVDHSKKWWFPLFNRKKKWERKITEYKEALASTLSNVNEILAALPA